MGDNKGTVGVKVVMVLFVIAYAITLAISLWWLLAAPLFIPILAHAYKSAKARDESKEILPTSLQTRLVTVGGNMNPCVIILNPDSLLVTGHDCYTKIPMETIEQVLFENKSTKDLDMAGFSVDYRDSEGPARVMFWNDGWAAVSKTRRQVDAIKSAHSAWYAGTNVPTLEVHDVGKMKARAANQAVHRAL